jgi:UDP-N-acetylglucosamine--N-acetylmuramyl-(pentapeptide) pyrophosphoryl-undecaprenol N-acetylglucosamine transferase
VIHLTGAGDAAEAARLRAGLTAERAARYCPFGYLHEDMAHALSAADMAVSRAGASVLGEMPRFRLPAVLVPYPHAWRYQNTNAEYMAAQGAAVTLQDSDLSSQLLPAVSGLLQSAEELERMAQQAGRLATPGAAAALAAQLERLAAGRG